LEKMMMVLELERGGVPVLVARTRVETAAHARRAGKTTFFRHQAMTARTGAGIFVTASLDARCPHALLLPLILLVRLARAYDQSGV
jgi:hypothetical protein